jgi:hypothetical protein
MYMSKKLLKAEEIVKELNINSGVITKRIR